MDRPCELFGVTMSDKRSQLIIKRHFQQGMILETLLVMFIMVNVIVIIAYFFIESMTDVQQLKHNLAFTVAALEVIGFVVFYRLNLRSSHRIAGPVFVVERGLKLMESGDLTFSVGLRQGDQFHEVKDQMNLTLAALKQRITKAQQLTEKIKSSSADASVVEELEQTLAYFKVDVESGEPESSAEAQE